MNASWTYEEIGQEIGQLVDEKNAAYGSSFAKAGPFLRMLYGDSLRPEQYDFLLINVRIFDKLMRAATDADAFGESPYRDIAGYALLAARMHEERKSGKCGSVSDTSAAGLSKEPSASAAQPAPAPTATNGDARNAKPSEPHSPRPHVSTSKSMAVPAAEKNDRGGVAARAKARNDAGQCAAFPCELGGDISNQSYCQLILYNGVVLWAHNDTCRTHFELQASRETGDPL